MAPSQAFVITAGLAYLIGSIPFSLLIARIFGKIDLRSHGSGNVGATNVARTMSAKWGAFALLLDAGKGMTAVGLIPVLMVMAPEDVIHQKVLAAVMAVVGHMYSCWIRFRGGKGVATALGAVTVLAPQGMLIALVGFILAFLATRIVSLSSIVAAAVFAVAQLLIGQNSLWKANTWSLGVFSVVVPALIIFQHRSNILRLLRGEEQKLQLRKSERQDSDETASEPPVNSMGKNDGIET
ncbi:Glycerol-3-phosphate acyltransferase [Thalassoglobus neptunius]|uniref:Glycerol-3-phosphate acyltransferase n=1 Tax=Thalassoglobus neptunius TaxID=1938619 RepID=A0A5C5WXI0_9PLAN|nr:glycerol-3-phosphate 1-O-acyltransferase PlsY [Thalassoglobus neptunius]TWT55280.1 Glycerol-3-phosphate acyltransferase [Thalassoglobus neptunius]